MDVNAMTVAALVGITMGVLGGLIGTRASLRNTSSDQERAFVKKAAIGIWAAVACIAAILFFLPRSYHAGVWLGFMLLLPLTVMFVNRRQAAIQSETGASAGADEAESV